MLGFEKAPSRRSLSSDLSWGFWQGCIAAFILSIFGVISVAFLGGGESLRRDNTTLGEVILVYWLTAPVAGLLVGLLRPALQRPATRWLTFTLGASVIGGGLFYLWSGPPSQWTLGRWIGLALVSSWYGLIGGHLADEDQKG